VLLYLCLLLEASSRKAVEGRRKKERKKKKRGERLRLMDSEKLTHDTVSPVYCALMLRITQDAAERKKRRGRGMEGRGGGAFMTNPFMPNEFQNDRAFCYLLK